MRPSEIIFSPHGFAIVLVTAIVVVACVLLHYESFSWLHKALTRLTFHVHRRRILFLMFGLPALHIIEVWLFGIGYYLLVDEQGASRLMGWQGGGLLEFVYFSAVVYTTLGLGDLIPLYRARAVRTPHAETPWHRCSGDPLIGSVPRDLSISPDARREPKRHSPPSPTMTCKFLDHIVHR